MYDLERLSADIDGTMIADALGIEVQQKGNVQSILCPCHNDKHFGSCILYDHDFYCFACGAHGSLYDLISAVIGCSKHEAFGIAADIAGGRLQYTLAHSDNADDDCIGIKMPSSKDAAFIGIHSGPVYAVRQFTDPGLEREEGHIYTKASLSDAGPQGSSDKTAYVPIDYLKTDSIRVINNPLRDLFRNDPDTAADLVVSKAIETRDMYRWMRKTAEEYNMKNDPEIYVCKLAAAIGRNTFLTNCAKLEHRAENIAYEFGYHPD